MDTIRRVCVYIVASSLSLHWTGSVASSVRVPLALAGEDQTSYADLPLSQCARAGQAMYTNYAYQIVIITRYHPEIARWRDDYSRGASFYPSLSLESLYGLGKKCRERSSR
jgi:hypothetical protein